MKLWKYALTAVSTALVLVACGGGDDSATNTLQPKPVFTSMVNFGDSLSDVGTYKVGAIAAVGGGQWTVNSPTAKNWTAVMASKLNVPAPCAAQTGLRSILPNLAAVDVQNIATCYNYAQGSSRVTSAFGPSSVAIQQAVLGAAGSAAAISAAGLGLMALPVVNQMANHATKVTTYSGNELVTVMAGGNDIFLNFNGVASAAAGGAAAAGAAQFAGWLPPVQVTVFGGGATATNAAIQAAVAGMGQAGTELATAVKSQVLAKGAKYVAVVNLPDVSRTPFGLSLDAPTQGLLVNMANAFNSALATGLVGEPRVVLVDAFTQSVLQATVPAQFSLTNVLTPACDASLTTTNILGGSSLTCTASNTLAGVDVSRYQYADSVHPTPFAYQLLADFVDSKLVAAGWR